MRAAIAERTAARQVRFAALHAPYSCLVMAGTLADASEKYCIIGAGSSGLAAAKNFREAGIPFDCLEREDDVGGNWYYGRPASSVYASTHLISSKRLTEYTDFPMPKEWAEFPSHAQAWEYLRSYAKHFGLYEHIQFGMAVERIEPVGGTATSTSSNSLPLMGRGREGWQQRVPASHPLPSPPLKGEGATTFLNRGWLVRLASGEERVYRGVVIANGHNWDPRWPEYPGEFTGESLHSSQYKTPDAMRGKRVLVVGGGNSGCDLAVEAATHAAAAIQSTRRRYPIVPKFWRGKPIDECMELMLWLRAPLWLRRFAGKAVSHLSLGPAERTGVPAADHRLFESHPVLNSQIHHHVGHGRLRLRPDVAWFEGRTVHFVDGTSDEVDLIIFATGFKVSFPFIDREHLNWRDGAPRLFLNVFHPERDDLFCIGLIQPDSGQFGIVDDQSRLVARYLQAKRRDAGRGIPGARWFETLKRGEAPALNGGVRYLSTPRHALEVEHWSYRRRLRKLWALLG